MRLPLLLAAAALVVSGCTGAPHAEDPAPGPDLATAERSAERYVALGDSFTAGPFVPTTDLAGGCFRSDHNYPSLLAEALDIEDFVDVSCSAARTRDLPHEQRTVRDARVPPQLDALSRDTTLVTLGIGGNDFDLYGDLTTTCLRLRDTDPTGSPCRDAMMRGEGPGLATVTARIGRNVERVLGQVARRAPDARVVLVGYPRIAPSTGECPELLPYATGDVPFGDEVLRRLTAALSAAADRAGVEFLDMYAASVGHDVCAAEPYVNGVNGDQQQAAPFHPFPRGMRAVARELAALLAHP